MTDVIHMLYLKAQAESELVAAQKLYASFKLGVGRLHSVSGRDLESKLERILKMIAKDIAELQKERP